MERVHGTQTAIKDANKARMVHIADKKKPAPLGAGFSNT